MTSKTAPKAPTINDVALAAGVSKATAAQVCRGTGRISAASRASVLAIAEQLGYKPNPHAQRLASGRCTNLIGLYSLNLELGPGTAKIKLIQSLLTEKGYDVPIHSYGSYGGGQVVNEVELMHTLCSQRPVAIVCSTFGVKADVLDELQKFQDAGGTVVCYDTEKEVPFDNVVYGMGDAIYQATHHLIELGHRKIGFGLHGLERPGEPNYGRFERALKDAGIPINRAWLFHGELYEEAGMRYAEQFLAMHDRPTAIHIAHDVAASAFINEVRRAGLRVPEDISVVGLNNSLAAKSAAVRLTSVSHPIEDIGREVVSMLDSRLNGGYDGPPRRTFIKGELFRRESTAPVSEGIL